MSVQVFSAGKRSVDIIADEIESWVDSIGEEDESGRLRGCHLVAVQIM
jgi:hypothetical protein